jgi:hypothetical protein
MASWTQLSAFSSVLAYRRLMVEVFVVHAAALVGLWQGGPGRHALRTLL